MTDEQLHELIINSDAALRWLQESSPEDLQQMALELLTLRSELETYFYSETEAK